MIICNNCLYQFDRKHCDIPDFGEVVRCSGYVDKKDFYKHPPHRKGYIIPYNFPLNTRRGFRTIYYLMRLTQSDMIRVITSIISLRHVAIDEIIDKCDNIINENNYILSFLLRGGYIG